MDTYTKLGILAEAAKFDAACTSSGIERGPQKGKLGIASTAGCCHSFTADGRCITLLKVLMSNACTYDCAYCVNRRSNTVPRATFSPRELAQLTVDFYKRNYIEGLFLSSGVLGDPDATTERMIECLRVLREDMLFNGYIHAKAIPGTSPELIDNLGRFADRLSVNIELPSADSLQALCPDKQAADVTRPMAQIARTIAWEHALPQNTTAGTRKSSYAEAVRAQNGMAAAQAAGSTAGIVQPYGAGAAPAQRGNELDLRASGLSLPAREIAQAPPKRKRRYRKGELRPFSPAGHSTQLIVGATPEDDNHILTLSQALYDRFALKRIFFSAYMPVVADDKLPPMEAPVPLRREHRLYQADWLMRFYDFTPDELVSPDAPWLDLDVDPKLAWALAHIDRFPLEVNEASYRDLLRVPGIGPTGAKRIVAARKRYRLDFDDLERLHIVLKRARHFLTCAGKRDPKSPLDAELIRGKVVADARSSSYNKTRRMAEGQLSLF